MEKLGKNLHDFAGKRGSGFDLKTVKRLTIEILTAISRIHEQGLTHYDIKPENILFIKDEHIVKTVLSSFEKKQRELWLSPKSQMRIPTNLQVKLIDFGFTQ